MENGKGENEFYSGVAGSMNIQMDRHEIISLAIALTEHSEKILNTFNFVQAMRVFRKCIVKTGFR